MIVGIDFRPALLAKTGIGRTVDGLVRGLIGIGRGEALRLHGVMRSARRHADRVPEGVEARLKSWPGRLADGLGRLGYTPDRAAGGCDVWHHTDFVVPRTRCPAIATIHDVVFLHDETYHGARRTRNLRRALERAKRRARLFLVPSRAAARDVETLAEVPAERIRVIPPGIDPAWIVSGTPPPRERPWILAVGSLEPRKNLPRLVTAFSRLAEDDPDHELLVVGPDHHEADAIRAAAAASPVADRIVFLGHVSDASLAGLYRGAAAVAYVSLREGFGLPALEGLVAGVPVVTSWGTSMEEAVGHAAILVDPTDERSIEEGLREALDPARAAALAEVGPARAARFSWARAATATWAAYEEAAGS